MLAALPTFFRLQPIPGCQARRLIDKHGYGRRLGELEDAERAAAEW